MLAEIERAEADGMHVLFIVFQEFHGKLRVFIPLAREPEKSHHVVPHPVLRGQFQAPFNHFGGRGLIHEFQDPLAAGFIAHVEELAPRVLGILPHLVIQQTFLEADVRGPRNAQLVFLELPGQFAEEGRRIGFIGEVKMPRVIFVAKQTNLLDDFLDLLGSVTGRVPFSMIAKLTPPPITPPRREIGQDGFRHEVPVQREPVKIRRRQVRHVLGGGDRRGMNARIIPPQEVRNFVEIPIGAYRVH